MIELADVRFAYPSGAFVIDRMSLAVASGETVAVTGRSGSGKTTLLNLMAGVLVPAAGRVAVDGTDLGALGDAARRGFRLANIGFVFQDIELLEYLDVRDNVLLPYRLDRSQKPDADAAARAERLLGEVGLSDKLRRMPGALSQGEQQRVGICRALVTEPAVVLADGPTSSLDADNGRAVVDTMLDLVRRRGTTLVVLTHDRAIVGRFDRVINLERA